MSTRSILAAAVAVAVLAACGDQSPTATDSTRSPTVPSFAQSHTTDLLSNLPVTGTLPGGGTFSGLLSITNLALQNGELVASGVLTGTSTVGGVVTQITQTFTNVPVDLASASGRCDILNLDLGPLFLDLLGLQVDLSAVNLDIVAQSGPGKLLGNLLCAVVHLLDAGGPLAGLQNLLNQINGLLGGLLG